MNNTILSISTSSDLLIFGKSFIYSSIVNKNRTHIHIINMTTTDKIFLDKMKEKTNLFSYSNSDIELSKIKKENIGVYFTYLKYKFFIELLKANKNTSIFYIDINSLIRTKIIPPAQDIGILLKKKYSDNSMKNVASVFYSNFRGIDYWEQVCETIHKNITNNKCIWFFDKKIISDTFKALDNINRVFSFSRKHCDWKCGTYSPIWTLKGIKKNYQDLYMPLAVSLFKTSTKNEREEYDLSEKQEYYNVKFVYLKIFYENIKAL